MNLPALLDAGLEWTIVGSFSRAGFALRCRLFRWTGPAPGAFAGRTVLVTGPTSGLGRAAASQLAELGARVILVGRDEARLAELRDALLSAHGEDRFPIVVADMGSLAAVRTATDRILEGEARLDVLIDNAGAIFPERREGPDGIEATLATLVVGPFVLISGLLPLLRATPGARVISVTSGGMYSQALDLDDLESTARPFSGPRAYARAKRAQVALVREWARRLGPADITVNAMHPGWAGTPGLKASLPGFYGAMGPLLRTPAEGIDTIVWLAGDPAMAGRSGKLYLDRRPRPFDRLPGTRVSPAQRRRLWELVVERSGRPDPAPER